MSGDYRRVDVAIDAFVPLLDDEIRRLVRLQMGREGNEITFQPTALVHEAGLRFMEIQGIRHRPGFVAIAVRAVRRALVDIAQTRASMERAGGAPQVASDEARVSGAWSRDLIALDDALTTLAVREPRQSQILELRFFGGLTVNDISDAITVAPATVKREGQTARAQLAHELERMDQWSVGPPP